MPGQNFSLEIINGVVTIDTFFFLVWCAYHLHGEFQRRTLTWWFALTALPSVAIVVSMFSEKLGSMATRSVVWVWRLEGGARAFTDIENGLLFGGSALTAVGLLWSIAILTRMRLGNWPWVIALTTTLLYVVVGTIVHLVSL